MPSSCLKRAQPPEPLFSARFANCSHPCRHLKGTRGETVIVRSAPDPAAATQMTSCFHGREGTVELSALQTIIHPCIHTCIHACVHPRIHSATHPCIHPEVWVGDDVWRVKSWQTQLGLQDSRDGFHGPQVLSPPGSLVLELRPAYWANSMRGKCTRLRQLAKSCLCFYWAHFSKV